MRFDILSSGLSLWELHSCRAPYCLPVRSKITNKIETNVEDWRKIVERSARASMEIRFFHGRKYGIRRPGRPALIQYDGIFKDGGSDTGSLVYGIGTHEDFFVEKSVREPAEVFACDIVACSCGWINENDKPEFGWFVEDTRR